MSTLPPSHRRRAGTDTINLQHDADTVDDGKHSDADVDGNGDDNNYLRRQLLFHDDEEETTIMRRHCALWNPHIGLYGAWDTQVSLVLLVLVLGLGLA